MEVSQASLLWLRISYRGNRASLGNCFCRALLSILTLFLQGQSASQLDTGVRTERGLKKPLGHVSSLYRWEAALTATAST